MRRATVVVLFIAIALTTIGVGAVSGQDADPTAFSGSVTDADGNDAPAGTTIVATIENGTGGETTIDTAGSYGAGGFSGDNLAVEAENADADTVTVRFYVGSADGPAAAENPVTEASGEPHTQNLTFPSGTFGSSDDGGDGGGVSVPSDDSTDDTSTNDTSTDDTTDDDSSVDTDGDNADDTTFDSADNTSDETSDESPGFGVVAALIALCGLLAVARARGSE